MAQNLDVGIPLPRTAGSLGQAVFDALSASGAAADGPSAAVGLPSPTLAFAPTASGERLGDFKLRAGADLPAPTLFSPDGTVSWGSTTSAPRGVRPSIPTTSDASIFFGSPGGAVAPGLRESAEPDAPTDAERQQTLGRTLFDTAWGSPPAPATAGLVWDDTLYVYVPTEDEAAFIYQVLASQGYFQQPYRTPSGPWWTRWIQIPADDTAPYRVVTTEEQVAIEFAVRNPLSSAALSIAQGTGHAGGLAWTRCPPGQPCAFTTPTALVQERERQRVASLGLGGDPGLIKLSIKAAPAFDLSKYAWVSQRDMPAACPYPYPVMPVPVADYVSGRWLGLDYVPSIELPPPYDQVPWRCNVAPTAKSRVGAAAEVHPTDGGSTDSIRSASLSSPSFDSSGSPTPLSASSEETPMGSRLVSPLLIPGQTSEGASTPAVARHSNSTQGAALVRSSVLPDTRNALWKPNEKDKDECSPSTSPVNIDWATVTLRLPGVTLDTSRKAAGHHDATITLLPGEPVPMALAAFVQCTIEHTCTCKGASCTKKYHFEHGARIDWTKRAGQGDVGFVGHTFAGAPRPSDAHESASDSAAVLLLPPLLDPPAGSSSPPRTEVTNTAETVLEAAVTLRGSGRKVATFTVTIKSRRVWGSEGPTSRAGLGPPLIHYVTTRDFEQLDPARSNSEGLLPTNVSERLEVQDVFVHDIHIDSSPTNANDSPQYSVATPSESLACPCVPGFSTVYGEPPALHPVAMDVDSAAGEIVAGEWYMLRVATGVDDKGYFSCTTQICAKPPVTLLPIHPESVVKWTAVGSDSNGWEPGTLLPGNPGSSALWKAPAIDSIVSIDVTVSNGGSTKKATLGPFRVVARVRPALIVGVFGGLSQKYGGKGDDPGAAIAPIRRLADKLKTGLGDRFAAEFVPMYSDIPVSFPGDILAAYDQTAGPRIAIKVAEWIDGLVESRQPVGPIVFIGHSWGANACAHAGRILAEAGVGVDEAFYMDRTRANTQVRGANKNIGPDAGLDVLSVTNWMAGVDTLDRRAFALAHGTYRPVDCGRVVQDGTLAVEDHGGVMYSRWAFQTAYTIGRFWRVYTGKEIAPLNSCRPLPNRAKYGMNRQSMSRAVTAVNEMDNPIFGTINCAAKRS
jgi:hypothetical protein